MKISLFFVLLMGCSAVFGKTTASALSQSNLDLPQAIRFAVERAPQFDSIRKKISISEAQEKNAYYKFFPTLDLSATHGLQGYDPKMNLPGEPSYSSTALSLTQPIYDNGESATGYKVARLSLEKAELEFVEQKNKLCLDVVNQFLAYSLNVKLLDIKESQFQLISKQFQTVSRDFYQGLKTKRDFLRFKTQVSRNEIDLINAKNNLEKSRQELLQVIGVPLDSQEQIKFIPLPLEKMTEDRDVKLIEIKNHFVFKSAQLQRQINDLNTNLMSRKKWPEWFLTAAATYGSSGYINSNRRFSDNDSLSWSALLTVKYNFVDWGARRRDTMIAQLQQQTGSNTLETQILSTNSLLKQIAGNWLQTQRNFDLSHQLLTLEKDNLRFIEREYQSGKVQYLDLITVYFNLADAEIKYYSSAADLQNLKYTMLYHQGTLYEEILK